MPTIAQNNFYTILTDPLTNRLYLTIMGFWNNRSEVPEYLNDLKKATQELKSGFTALANLTKIKVPSQEVTFLHIEAQKLLIDAGLEKTAEVVGKSALVKMSFDRFSKESGMIKKTFSNKIAAGYWLDEKEEI